MAVDSAVSTNRPARRGGRLGIGMRLMLAFASVAALTTVGALASCWFALQTSDIVSSLGSRTLPTITASLMLAQRSSVLAAQAPSLAAQKDAAALDAESARLSALLAEQKARLETLRGLIQNPGMLDAAAAMGTALGSKIDALKALTGRRIALAKQIAGRVADTISAFQDFSEFLRPLVEQTRAAAEIKLDGLKNVQDSAHLAAETAGFAKNDMPAEQTLMDIEANGNLAVGMLAAASTAPKGDGASDIRSQYDWAELYLNKALDDYQPGDDHDRLVRYGKALLAAGSGPESIFKLRDTQRTLDAGSDALLREMVDLSNKLGTEVERLAKAQEDAAAAAAGHSAIVTRLSLFVNAGCIAIVLLASALIGWLYVGRLVVARLNRLARTMGRIAGGERRVEVETGGRDEIGDMAAAVQVFKENIARADALAAETERLSAERRAAREQAEAERAAAAASQAAVVRALADGLARLAQGDLTCLIAQSFAPEYESLRLDFNATVTQLEDVIRQIVADTHAIGSGTAEITQAQDDLSRRTEEQAARLEETAAALEEITATVKQTAESAAHARQVVAAAKTSAEHSGEVVRGAVAAMSGIEESARQIGQIIGVIDEIAFQTNLLALNAGVEAARAGDSGRGFAVVASEVRALAQRSAEAAKEIKALISTSSHQVAQGVDLVGETGKALERIVAEVVEINGIVAAIAASAREQATGLDQVNSAVTEMDQVTQQNAAMVEQSTAASHNLTREAEDLSRLTGHFRIEGGGTAHSKAAPQPPRRNPAAAPARRRVAQAGGGRAVEPADDWEEF